MELERQKSYQHLVKFKKAKQELGKLYDDVWAFLNGCSDFFGNEVLGDKFSCLVGETIHADIQQHMEKVSNIQGIISRNQMKCAFFGRTSNGKSTVINAMLGARLLPSGLGHTTNCFLEVQGTSEDSGYLITPFSDTLVNTNSESNSPQPKPIESVGQLAHALSGVKLAAESLIKIYWPSSHCRLLREDVVLLDSPGINVDPDVDRWIDSHCLDADVFILVANAESTLMQAEKDFFHKVSQRLSKPNIFIINNRWDASANELEYVIEVREQHMQRCVNFLVDELKVCSRTEAEEHVFFVSAREALSVRISSNAGLMAFGSGAPPSTDQLGLPSPAMPFMAEGWEVRLKEFSNFEVIFEKNLSESATRTKFATHCEQAKQIIEHFRTVMESIYEKTIEEKDAAVRCRCISQTHLDDVRVRLDRTNNTLDEMVRICLARVEAQVANALNAEIRRLGELVDAYASPFQPDPAMLLIYKRELNTHVERELGRKLAVACTSDILNEVTRSEQIMMSKLAAIVNDEVQKSHLLQAVDPTAFQPEFHVDCRNLCADFTEDIRFRFSLGLGALFERLSAPKRQHGWSHNPGATVHSAMVPWAVDLFPSLLSRNSVGTVVIFGLVSKMVGWRVLGILAGLYGGLYVYERLAWTNKAKEATFKRQYVDFASQKLRLIVDLTSNNARHQVKRELYMAQKKLTTRVDAFSQSLEEGLRQLDEDVVHLDSITANSKRFKACATSLLQSLNQFQDQFITSVWHDTSF